MLEFEQLVAWIVKKASRDYCQQGDTLEPKMVKRKIVACLSSLIGAKHQVAKEAGGIGMIMCNDENMVNIADPAFHVLPVSGLRAFDSKGVFPYIILQIAAGNGTSCGARLSARHESKWGIGSQEYDIESSRSDGMTV
ncbi:hypothetical protein EJ110_NYTH03401 [Nymphaea thermarum]|nr:hypothetical protein EJ110_NYTH03401 [Nymphaea thermarum]